MISFELTLFDYFLDIDSTASVIHDFDRIINRSTRFNNIEFLQKRRKDLLHFQSEVIHLFTLHDNPSSISSSSLLNENEIFLLSINRSFTCLYIWYHCDIEIMTMDRKCIDHPQQHRQVSSSDLDYVDVLQRKKCMRDHSTRWNLPKIANGKSNGMMILLALIFESNETMNEQHRTEEQ